MAVRLDKWLQVARAFKTRSQATRACNLGRIRTNGTVAKAHRQLAVGDRIEIEMGGWTRLLLVKELRDRPLPRAEVGRLYDDLSPPRPERDPLQRPLHPPTARREKGSGRPTKRQRRQIDRWLKGR